MLGAIRPGGPDAGPSRLTVAQMRLEFPSRFGAQGLVDVKAGYVLGEFGSLEDARWGARTLAEGRASMGVIRQPNGRFTVSELLVPDVIEPVQDWTHVKDVTLILGPDPILPRQFAGLQRLADGTPEHGELMSVWTRSGNTRWDVGADGEFAVTFNHM
ncbi:MAG: hypothetical protein JWM86_1466 [Thermoleophilia bacterium]|nr:hypothetical protein [Thermoleophilia bacterium]